MMHEAYNVYHLTKISSIHIESIAAFDNNIILGTRSGQLLTYLVKKNPIDNNMELDLVHFYTTFSKKPIIQIEVVPEEFFLFTLSDSMLSVSLMTGRKVDILYTAAQTKGASLFCIDVQKTTESMTSEIKTIIRVCVAVKRKLQFYIWENNKLVELKNSIELKDLPKAISMFSDDESPTDIYVCVGFKDDYVLYGIFEDTPPVKHDLFVTSSTSSQDPCICVLKNVFGLIKNQFLAIVDPKDELQTYRDSKNAVEGKSVTKEKRRNSTFKDLKALEWSQPALDLVWDEPFIIGRTANGLEVQCFDLNGLNKQSLIQSFPDLRKARLLKRSGKGTIFAASLSDFWFMERVDISKQIQNLQKQKKFQLAIELTNTTDSPAKEKEETIKKIRTRFAKELFRTNQFHEAMQEFAKSQTGPYDVIRLFPNLFPNDSQSSSPSHNDPNIPQLEDKDLENALVALQGYLETAKKEEKARINKAHEKDKNNKDSKPKVSTLLSVLDTTLLKTYLQTNHIGIENLLRNGHYHFEETEKTLIKYKKFSELKILYNTHGKHKKALELLKSQSDRDGAIKYLQRLGSEHKYLIFDYSDWVLKEDPKSGLKIFTENFDEVRNMPRSEVLDFLLKSHRSLVIPYLEHIIEEWQEEKPIFHNYLINQYRKEIDTFKMDLTKENVNAIEKSEAIKKTRNKLLNFLKTSNIYSPENVLKDLPTNDLFEERAIILGKLKKHIKVLVVYIQVLGNIEKATEYCEQVYSEEKNIFVHLIKKLLTPPDSPPYSGVELHPICLKPNPDIVLDLLDKYGTKMDPVEVLTCLPDDIPVFRLKDFLENTLRSNLESRRNSQILNGLLYAVDLQLKELSMQYEKKSIVVNHLTVCPVCKKRFTSQSAFVKYPDGEIVHFSCQDKKINP